jgi:hypothetical protein
MTTASTADPRMRPGIWRKSARAAGVAGICCGTLAGRGVRRRETCRPGRVEGAGPSRAAQERFPPPRRPAGARGQAAPPVSSQVYARGCDVPPARRRCREDCRSRTTTIHLSETKPDQPIRTAMDDLEVRRRRVAGRRVGNDGEAQPRRRRPLRAMVSGPHPVMYLVPAEPLAPVHLAAQGDRRTRLRTVQGKLAGHQMSTGCGHLQVSRRHSPR